MTCPHPPPALRSWFASDASTPTGRTLVIVCTQCRTVLKGGVTL